MVLRISSLVKYFLIVFCFISGASVFAESKDHCVFFYKSSYLVQQLSSKINRFDWTLSSEVRARKKNQLWLDVSQALHGSSKFSLEQVRQLAWAVLSQTRKFGSQRTESLDILLLDGYLTRLSLAEDAQSLETNVIDWIKLLEVSGLESTTSFANETLWSSGNLVSTLEGVISHSMKKGVLLKEEDISQLVRLLQMSIEIGQKRVAITNSEARNSRDYLTADRVADNLFHLIKIDIVRQNPNFISLIQSVVFYLEANNKGNLAADIKAAMQATNL